MKKYLVVTTLILTALTVGFMMGCSEEPNTIVNPQPTDVATIELRLTHNKITGFIGDLRTETVTAIARNANGVAVPNQKMEFAILDQAIWKGTVILEDSVTNYDGESKATYRVELQRSATIKIKATSGSVTAEILLAIEIVEDVIDTLKITAPSVLTVRPNQVQTASVSASLVDTIGRAIPGILVHFRTSPPENGYVYPDTGTTDYNGRVVKTFSTVPGNYGPCSVFAEVGSHMDSTTIEIIPIANPRKIQVWTLTPDISVVQDQNAAVDITAVVTDDHGVGVPNASIRYRVSGVETFGSLSPTDTTDENGIAITTFHTLGGSGRLWIKAEVLSISDQYQVAPDSLQLTVSLLTNNISRLNLAVSPSYLNLPPDSVGMAMVSARVVDQESNGIPNLRVNFDCTYGTLANPMLTDSTGVATAEYYILPLTDFPEGDIPEIEVEIRASIPETIFDARTVLTVEKTTGDIGSLALTSDVDFIYADRGLTVARLQAVLKDANNQSLTGREVIFTASHGTVNSPVITDTLGIAHAVFTDVGVPSVEGGEIVPAIITAIYNPWPPTSIEITIEERQLIDAISLRAARNQMVAGSGDSTWVGATCILANGAFGPEGTLVFFETDKGRFVDNAVPVRGNNGEAINYYIADPVVGTAHLHAYVMNGDTAVYSNIVEIELIAGPPTRITVAADPNRLHTTEPTVSSVITATVRDTSNNIVGNGILVTFAATLGALNSDSRSTNDDGQAIVELTPGVNSGVSVVTATVNTPAGDINGNTTVEIVAGDGNSIELAANPNNIAVGGTGVNSSSTLTATLFDPNRNLIESAVWVIFEILNEPSVRDGGCYFSNREQIDSARTAAGRARVTLNAGTVVGGKLLRATSYFNNREDTVSVTLSRVSVTAGPPDRIDIDVGNEGDDVDGAAWNIEVSARIFDMHMNAVSDSIPVVFSCDSVATIGNGFTGNESRNGNATPGIAYTSLVYHSWDTYDTLTIVAEVQSPERTITGERFTFLPLQEGVLVLQCDPTNWEIDVGPDSCNIRCWVELVDGHDVLIDNAPILFTSSRAKFFWYNYMPGRRRYYLYDHLADPPVPARKYTGWNLPDHPEHREQPGQATVFLKGSEFTFFLDPVTPEVNVQIGAMVEGNDEVIADPVIIVITRHP